VDLNIMMREQAKAGLERELAEAVTNGDTEAAKKVTDKIAALAVASAPTAPPYGQEAIRAELGKAEWFGVDPEKSALAMEFGKTMDPKKFATAADFAATLIKAVEAKFAKPAPKGEEGEDGGDAEGEDGGDEDGQPARSATKTKKTDGPGEGEATVRGTTRRTTGPWTKLSDAPADVQREINRTADKFAGTGEGNKAKREAFVTRALDSHYAAHQRKGKK